MNQIEFGDEYFSVLFVIFRSMGAGLLHKKMSGLVISVFVQITVIKVGVFRRENYDCV